MRSFDSIDNAPKKEKERGLHLRLLHVETILPANVLAHVDCPGHADYGTEHGYWCCSMGRCYIGCCCLLMVLCSDREHILFRTVSWIPRSIVFLNKFDMGWWWGAFRNCWKWEVRELLSFYEYDGGHGSPVILFCFGALNGNKWVIQYVLMEAVDSWIEFLRECW